MDSAPPRPLPRAEAERTATGAPRVDAPLPPLPRADQESAAPVRKDSAPKGHSKAERAWVLNNLRFVLPHPAGAQAALHQIIVPVKRPAADGSGRIGGSREAAPVPRLREAPKPPLQRSPGQSDLSTALGGMHPKMLKKALEERGIRPQDLKLKIFNDSLLDQTKSQEDFAKGGCNSVAKLVYGAEIRVFKEEQVAPGMPQIATQFDIDADSPRFGNRNIASKAVADVLGTGVIADSCFTVHNGKVGLCMEMAKGIKLSQIAGWDPDVKPKRAEFREKLTPKVVTKLHEKLNGLEWTDMITGQGDRHWENYLVDIVGDDVKITGIDNDVAFGPIQSNYKDYGSQPKERKNVKAGAAKVGERGRADLYRSAELPVLIDAATYERLKSTDFHRDIAPKLTGLLTEKELEASAKRFANMKKHARSLDPDYVVADWSIWRSPSGLFGHKKRLNASEFLASKTTTSLFDRDIAPILTG